MLTHVFQLTRQADARFILIERYQICKMFWEKFYNQSGKIRNSLKALPCLQSQYDAS